MVSVNSVNDKIPNHWSSSYIYVSLLLCGYKMLPITELIISNTALEVELPDELILDSIPYSFNWFFSEPVTNKSRSLVMRDFCWPGISD